MMDRELVVLLEDITSSLRGLTASQTQAVPAAHPEKWSIQQIMEHLHLTYLSTVKVLEGRIAKGHPTLSRSTMKQQLTKLLTLQMGYIPRGRRAPQEVNPSTPTTLRSGDELIARAEACLLQIDLLTRRGEEMFGTLPAVSHSILGPLTMAQWRRFHRVHGHHHVKQIMAVRVTSNTLN